MSSQSPFEPSTPSRPRIYLALLSLITLAFCIWILALPLFPSNDGPMHLYYTSILHDLLFQHGDRYSEFFRIKNLLPPYSLYYYLLMGLGDFVSLFTADKIIVCLYIVSFSFGLRYLTTAVGSNGDIMALAAAPLLLNWSLFMGFVNFCLATTMMFWALGLWCRFAQRPNYAKRISFLILVYAILLTHPVPLIFLMGFCIFELCVRFFRRRHLHVSVQQLGVDALFLLLAGVSFVYMKHFTNPAVLAQRDGTENLSLFSSAALNARFILNLHYLLAFNPAKATALLDLLCGFILLAAMTLVSLQLWHRFHEPGTLLATWTLADTWSCLTLLFCAILPFVPRDLNGSFFFGARLVLYLWIIALTAASGYQGRLRFLRPATAIVALLMAAQQIVFAQRWIAPAANRIAAQQHDPPITGHRVGLLLYTQGNGHWTDKPGELTFNPFFWAGADVFRASDYILYDSPWLQLEIIPIGAKAGMSNSRLPPRAIEQEWEMRAALENSKPLRDFLLSKIDFAVLVNGSEQPKSQLNPLLALDADTRHPWSCRPYQWYSFCERAK